MLAPWEILILLILFGVPVAVVLLIVTRSQRNRARQGPFPPGPQPPYGAPPPQPWDQQGAPGWRPPGPQGPPAPPHE